METGDWRLRWWTRDEFSFYCASLVEAHNLTRECWWKVGDADCVPGWTQKTEDLVVDLGWDYFTEALAFHKAQPTVIGRRFRYRLCGFALDHDDGTASRPFFVETLLLAFPRLNCLSVDFMGREAYEIVFPDL